MGKKFDFLQSYRKHAVSDEINDLIAKFEKGIEDKPQVISRFSIQLTKLRWSQAELARRIDVHPNTVSHWVTGKRPIPGAVKAYVDLALKVKGLID